MEVKMICYHEGNKSTAATRSCCSLYVVFYQTCRRRRPVSIKFSIKGVKLYDEDETVSLVVDADLSWVCFQISDLAPLCLQTLLMAHALRRVSLSTARPVDAQFAFVSHNPGSVDAQLYCHVFQARHARAVRYTANVVRLWQERQKKGL